tara:strand:+ start:2230 stop:2607 length:378 start_codon:yes stop_codon:yes gene_type:complete
MAAVKTTTPTALATNLVVQIDADENTNNNVTGGAGSLYMLKVDTTANTPTTAEPGVYVKVADGNISVTSTAPGLVFYVPHGTISTMVIPTGWAFSTNLSFYCVTGAALSSNSGPSAKVVVTVLAS